MVTTVRTHPRPSTAEECFAAMERHNRVSNNPVPTRKAAQAAPYAQLPPHGSEAPPGQAGDEGDILYGAKAIARYIFGDDSNRSRRRVFNLWAHYQHSKQRTGFLKLKGALCLSKSQWKAFHGLG
jgi:hypothetical protein